MIDDLVCPFFKTSNWTSILCLEIVETNCVKDKLTQTNMRPEELYICVFKMVHKPFCKCSHNKKRIFWHDETGLPTLLLVLSWNINLIVALILKKHLSVNRLTVNQMNLWFKSLREQGNCHQQLRSLPDTVLNSQLRQTQSWDSLLCSRK